MLPSSGEQIRAMSLPQAIRAARDIHACYLKKRRSAALREWDAAWVEVYDEVLWVLDNQNGETDDTD